MPQRRTAIVALLALAGWANLAAAQPPSEPVPPNALALWTISETFDRAVLSFQGPGQNSLADATTCKIFVRESAEKPWREVLHKQPGPDGKPSALPLPAGEPFLDEDTITCPSPMTMLRVDRPVTLPAGVVLPAKVAMTHWTEATVKPLSGPAVFVGKLKVPFTPQRDAGKEIASRVCSPSVVTMMLQYFGKDLSIAAVAQQAYDQTNDIYGNWSRAAWVLSSNGVPAHVQHLTSTAEIDASLAAGHPIAVSIRYGKGELPGAMVSGTDGHLVLIIGQTPAGDFIMNDAASWEHGAGAVYPRQPFLKAMANASNIAYVIEP